MKRKIASAVILLFVFFSGVVAAGGANGQFAGYDIIKIFSANKELQPEDVPAINFKGRTMVPIGALKQLGVDVKWDASRQRVDVSLPVRTVPVLTAEQLDSLSKYVYEVFTAPTDGHPNGKQGSAFIVDGYMVTNAHVAGDASFAQVQIDGTLQKATSYDFNNATTDVMGWKVQGGKSLPYSAELPQENDPVYCIGFPHGKLSITEGKVVTIFQEPNGVNYIVHSAPITNGSSGSFLLDGRGEVIGVNRGVTGEDGGINSKYSGWAVPISYVLAEINK